MNMVTNSQQKHVVPTTFFKDAISLAQLESIVLSSATGGPDDPPPPKCVIPPM